MILHADSVGEGPPLVLLHGLFGRARNLASVARGLAVSHRVLSLDLRNHGDSPHAPGMSYAELAGDVLETLTAHGLGRVDMLGHSMGGKVAMTCALRAPECVARLLVGDIAPVAYDHRNAEIAGAMRDIVPRAGMTRSDVAAALGAAVPDPGVRVFLAQNFQPGASPGWGIGLDSIARGMADIQGWPAFPRGSRFDGPVLFVTGEASDYVGAAHHPPIRALFPAARFMTVENAGHWLHADQPVAFLRVAREFFQ